MTPKEIFDQIYEMQAKLNRYIGRDTLNCPPEYLKDWITDYLWALHDEATELSNCFRWKWWDAKVRKDENNRFELFDENNAKIELIDIIHFFISLCHLIIVDDDEAKTVVSDLLFSQELAQNNYIINVSSSFKVVQSLIFYIILTFEQVNSDNKSAETLEIPLFILASHIGTIADILDMTPEEILNVYKKKCEINFKRQEQSYAMDTKTEEDNIKLAKTL